jgi:hypothetical protein
MLGLVELTYRSNSFDQTGAPFIRAFLRMGGIQPHKQAVPNVGFTRNLFAMKTLATPPPKRLFSPVTPMFRGF